MMTVMGAQTGDELHYSDGSHRWTPPPGVSRESWQATVRAHMEAASKAGGCDQVPKPGVPQRPQKRNAGPVIPKQRRT